MPVNIISFFNSVECIRMEWIYPKFTFYSQFKWSDTIFALNGIELSIKWERSIIKINWIVYLNPFKLCTIDAKTSWTHMNLSLSRLSLSLSSLSPYLSNFFPVCVPFVLAGALDFFYLKKFSNSDEFPDMSIYVDMWLLVFLTSGAKTKNANTASMNCAPFICIGRITRKKSWPHKSCHPTEYSIIKLMR